MTHFRPPAVPLATIDPYFNIWSMADRLYDDHTRHWTGKSNSMTGLIIVDGKPRKFMGKMELSELYPYDEPPALEQTALEIEPMTTTYTFAGEGIEFKVQFTSPLLLNDLDLLSRPVTYVTFQVRSLDGEKHDVKIYFDVSGECCVHTTDQEVVWERGKIESNIITMRMGTKEQPILQRAGDDTRIDWGYFYVVVKESESVKTVIHSYDVRKYFVQSGLLPQENDHKQPRAVRNQTPVMALLMEFPEVTEDGETDYFLLAYDDIHSIEYFGKPLDAYWRRNGQSFTEMLEDAVNEYDDVLAKCAEFENELNERSFKVGGEKYKDILALAYRQSIAAHKLVTGENGEILFFSKENFSNGCIATVDVSYPSTPLYLLYNPELVKGMMRPVFRYAASPEWKFEFAPHDVGTYPKANGQVYGENKLEFQMPIEECGNMLIMVAAVSLYGGDSSFAKENWELLSQWANYLLKHGMDPENQLCTDDFAGHLARNANLSIKAIIGIGAYAIICHLLGDEEGKERYLTAAKEMAKKWEEMARVEDHSKLTFDSSADTWSLKYNLVWDHLFGLHLFSDDLAETEVKYYQRKSNQYGPPLDNRNTYTKADWLVWAASMAKEKEEFEKMIAPLWYFLHETKSRVPFTDWYDTVTGRQIGFQNRSVVGGVFIRLLEPKVVFSQE